MEMGLHLVWRLCVECRNTGSVFIDPDRQFLALSQVSIEVLGARPLNPYVLPSFPRSLSPPSPLLLSPLLPPFSLCFPHSLSSRFCSSVILSHLLPPTLPYTTPSPPVLTHPHALSISSHLLSLRFSVYLSLDLSTHTQPCSITTLHRALVLRIGNQQSLRLFRLVWISQT